jgi:hypothetical protein
MQINFYSESSEVKKLTAFDLKHGSHKQEMDTVFVGNANYVVCG